MSSSPRPGRSFGRSLYWRIGFGFILFLGITLALQFALFIWVAGETEGGMPERMGRDFAELVASEFEAAIARDPAIDLEAYARKRINELHRPAVIIFADGRTVAPPGVTMPQGMRMPFRRSNGRPSTSLGTGGGGPGPGDFRDRRPFPRPGLSAEAPGAQAGPPPRDFPPPGDGPPPGAMPRMPFGGPPRRAPVMAPIQVNGDIVAMVWILRSPASAASSTSWARRCWLAPSSCCWAGPRWLHW